VGVHTPWEIKQKKWGSDGGDKDKPIEKSSASSDGEEVELVHVDFTFVSSPTPQEATDSKKGALYPGDEITGTEEPPPIPDLTLGSP